MRGKVIQNLSGQYVVLTENGCIHCGVRGIFRKDHITLSAGDDVEIQMISEQEGIIEQLHPRKNSFIRPKISNIDMFCYVLSCRYPEPDPVLIDKMTVLAGLKNIEIVLILNKTDLDDDKSAGRILDIYSDLGFTVIRCSAVNMEKADDILRLISGKTAALTGNTGVGKSSILNTLGIGSNAKVSEISLKLGRGRHTTREVTFYLLPGGGMLADTPGFGNIDITLENDLNTDNLASFFPDFVPWMSQCRFADCTHTGECGCMIADRVQCGEIKPTRYKSYLQMYNSLKNRNA